MSELLAKRIRTAGLTRIGALSSVRDYMQGDFAYTNQFYVRGGTVHACELGTIDGCRANRVTPE